MRSEYEMERAVASYSDMVRRICFLHLKNRHDTEDVFQNVFLKYLLYEGHFADYEHEKAWMIRVTINACKDWIKVNRKRNIVSLEVIAEEAESLNENSSFVLEAVMQLPDKYKSVIYLYYYEQYSAIEIAGILHKKENTIYTRLARAKAILKDMIGGEWA